MFISINLLFCSLKLLFRLVLVSHLAGGGDAHFSHINGANIGLLFFICKFFSEKIAILLHFSLLSVNNTTLFLGFFVCFG